MLIGDLKDQVIADLKQALAEKDREIEQLKAERCLQHNSARMLARYVVQHVSDVSTHDDGELLNEANGFLKSDMPRTTPWLAQLMNVNAQYQQIMAQAMRFAQRCVKPIRGKVAIKIEKEAQAFLKEHS